MGDESYLERTRKNVFDGEDRDHYLHIGYFMSWYSSVELGITFLLAIATGIRNLEAFELLVRGMDARVKIDRLRKAIDQSATITIGPNLSSRIDLFYDKIIPVRNNVAHASLASDPQRQTLHFASLAKLPFHAHGLFQHGEPPPSVPLIDIFEHALWLNFFSDDLNKAINQFPRQMLEIDNPRSPMRPVDPQDHPPSKKTSKPGRRERKRARKGLQTRTGKI
jgi:hypothetical protein